jgi:hypothetical protein
MDEKVEELSPVDENVFKGTNFFALCKWLMTQWSENARKDVSAHFIRNTNFSQWHCGSAWTKGGLLRTVLVFLDGYGPTHAYVTCLPWSVKMHFWSLRNSATSLSCSQWRKASYIVGNPTWEMISSEIPWGK